MWALHSPQPSEHGPFWALKPCGRTTHVFDWPACLLYQGELEAGVRHLFWHSLGESCSREHEGVLSNGSPSKSTRAVAARLVLLNSTFRCMAAVQVHRVAAEDPQERCNLLQGQQVL